MREKLKQIHIGKQAKQNDLLNN
uniref:Uncharacterized protein n=1 Tax=Arundo donax TaxID=35708 RepID=A0A0A9BMB6_ARUDO